MKRVLSRSVLALGLVAGCLLWGPRLAAQELPRAEDILDREAEAVGGKAASQKLKTVVVKGRISIQGMEGRFVRYQAVPNKRYEELTIEGLLKMETGRSGEVAWEKSSLTGSRLLEAGERAKAAREADIQGNFDWRKHTKQARTVGEEKVEGKLAYKIQVTTLEGEVVIAHYDKQSGLQVRQEGTQESPQGKMSLIAFFSDHRKVDGIVYPFTTKILSGPAEVVMTVDRIEHNVDIPEARFAVPADVNRLVERQKKQ